MEFDHILIRFGEMALKGKNRKHFERQLLENVQFRLGEFRRVKVKKTRGRMYVLLNGEDAEEVMKACQQVFGIYSLSFAIHTENELEKLKEAVLSAVQAEHGARTFKISAKRADKSFPLTSDDLNPALGGHILKNTEGLSVDVHHPDVELKVEIRHEGAYVTSKDYPGAGGFPVGTTGKAMIMLSGGIDSPVAGYLTMKRGVEIEAVHFHSPPYTNERAKQKVLDIAQELSRYGKRIKVHIVPFTAIQQKIHKDIPDSYGMTITRRMMLKITEKIARQQGALAITTGESLGQVASQTMESMNTINEVTDYPVIRPLVTMDKLEIINIAEKIDTYDISIRPYEDCCTIFVPKEPKTKPNREKTVAIEQSVDFSGYIEEAVGNIETIHINGKSEGRKQESFADLF
ncbi:MULTISPECIES: tRNA uracil 4-sulfurtransferase ThiI [Salimicrobium]|uniref:Probable tRNA sulfurtransferase n=1 Tax=Salimicrobium humidisoli TaxID=2029857 RepID=A0ABX4HV39_9BACI|nr:MULTISPECIES: tRNA uracil 4-sulfurtransferase ThiI [Salimicrobium]PBB06692.1 tRNA 4-thiouridine(8) synthase ThiI [Salimicrobium humidisoli]